MARTARKKSASGVYHVVLRGINKQSIFFDEEDREVFLNRLKLAKSEEDKKSGNVKKNFELYAFCLMTNHIHLLVKEEALTVGNMFRKILSSYVYWYNQKYKRVGNLFQDRFRSDAITNDSHMLCALRYIHQNPLKAGMVKSVGDYKWSSHSAYKSKADSFVDTELALEMLGGVARYEEFMRDIETERFSEDERLIVLSDEDVSETIKEIMQVKNIYDLQKCSRAEIEEVISTLWQKAPLASIRQVSRITGISVSIVRYIE